MLQIKVHELKQMQCIHFLTSSLCLDAEVDKRTRRWAVLLIHHPFTTLFNPGPFPLGNCFACLVIVLPSELKQMD